MNQGHADFRGSLEPNDEVMPYSDDETDDELDASSEEEEVEELPGAPQPAADARPSGEPSASTCLVFNSSAAFFIQVTFQSVSFSEMPWKVKANDRPYHHLPEFETKVFLFMKKSRYSVSLSTGLPFHGLILILPPLVPTLTNPEHIWRSASTDTPWTKSRIKHGVQRSHLAQCLAS